MKKKILITIILVVVILVAVVANIYILSGKKGIDENVLEVDGIKLVKDKSILKDTKVDDLYITDISLTTRDNVSTYYAVIKNNTKKNIYIDKIYVVFFEENIENKILASSSVKLVAGNSTTLNIVSESDLSKTTKIEYVIEYGLSD